MSLFSEFSRAVRNTVFGVGLGMAVAFVLGDDPDRGLKVGALMGAGYYLSRKSHEIEELIKTGPSTLA